MSDIYRYFNSIKVQLKPAQSAGRADAPQFQFHKGTIKTPDGRQYSTAMRYFNSIKVQLKLYYIVKAEFIRIFQFHKGTIKTQ